MSLLLLFRSSAVEPPPVILSTGVGVDGPLFTVPLDVTNDDDEVVALTLALLL